MPRIIEARIQGLRSLADVTVPLDGLTVLIGDNGAGKSSILEALRITRLAAGSGFMDRLSREHTLAGACRSDGALIIQVHIATDQRELVYLLRLDQDGRELTSESIFEPTARGRLDDGPPPFDSAEVIRAGGSVHRPDGSKQAIGSSYSLFEFFGRKPDIEAVALVREALEGIDTHLPFGVSASWGARAVGRKSAMREPQVIEPSARLELFGANLANVYQNLKNSGAERWRETLELLGLGIGPQLREVLLTAVAGGHLSLSLELHGVGHVPAMQLADGQLAYLAFVALVQLDPGRTLLSFDEPEQHLHPALLGRVVQLLEAASERYPVVLATHSDRLLDFLPNPAAALLVCELDAESRTVLRRLDGGQLGKWLERYRGLGELRAAGQLRSVLADWPDEDEDEGHAA